MRALLVALLTVSVALSGCADNDADPNGQLNGTDGTESHDDHEMADTGPPFLELDDPWAESDRIELWSGPLSPSLTCVGAGPTLGGNSCATFTAGNADAIPPGTQTIELVVDNAQVDQFVWIREPNDERWDGASQAGPTITWDYPVDEAFWEWAGTSWFAFSLFTDGTGTQSGAFAVTITAIKDPEWELPPLVDPWQDPTNRSYTDEGSMVLHWSNETYQWTGNAQHPPGNGGFGSQRIRAGALESVPLGTTHVSIGVRTSSVPSCTTADGGDCFSNFKWTTPYGIAYHYNLDGDPEYGSDWVVRVFDTETFVVPDSYAAAESASFVELWLYHCNAFFEAQGGRGACDFEYVDTAFDASVLVEAWRGPPDMDAFKQRLGV